MSFGGKSFFKNWDDEELVRCGAIHTNITSYPTLSNKIHPVFTNFTYPKDDPSLLEALRLSLQLATLLLESAGLPWLSEFCIDDIFSPSYPGYCPDLGTPLVVVRHHHNASWAGPDVRAGWLEMTDKKLREANPQEIEWRLDDEIFGAHGWIGYTARQQDPSRKGIELVRLDTPAEVRRKDWEAWCRGQGRRCLSVLVMRQYAEHLRALERGSEQWLWTAFMCAGTLLHEVGHVMYWRDFRAFNRNMTEPYFGGDLEMELGDSFVASIFGGWVPVPIENRYWFKRCGGRFLGGLAWRQHLTWDWHRRRPKFRVHYSVRVDYVAALFKMENWRKHAGSPERLVRPWTLPQLCHRSTELVLSVSKAGYHASAALPDYDECEGQRVWKRRPAADFRIPLYRYVVLDEEDHESNGILRSLIPHEPDVRDRKLHHSEVTDDSSTVKMLFWDEGNEVGKDNSGLEVERIAGDEGGQLYQTSGFAA